MENCCKPGEKIVPGGVGEFAVNRSCNFCLFKAAAVLDKSINVNGKGKSFGHEGSFTKKAPVKPGLLKISVLGLCPILPVWEEFRTYALVVGMEGSIPMCQHIRSMG